jgi:hypothetical protein
VTVNQRDGAQVKVLGGVTPHISSCLARLTRAEISRAHRAVCFPLDLEEGQIWQAFSAVNR